MDIKVVDEKKLNESVEIVCRQTDYSKEKAIDKLGNNNLDVVKVIKEYLSNKEEIKEEIKEERSLNEMIHQEIRTFMKQ
jgi:hypothetical protein|tara:strand:+ start:171 stop:407 length:237 start_codon:yes stop_codon:yes gene_type:complete